MRTEPILTNNVSCPRANNVYTSQFATGPYLYANATTANPKSFTSLCGGFEYAHKRRKKTCAYTAVFAALEALGVLAAAPLVRVGC